MRYFVRITCRAMGLSALLSAAAFMSAQDHPSSAPPDSLPLKVCSKTNPQQPCATAPHPIYTPDPVYSDKARKKKKNGTVTLETIVGTDGLTHDIHVLQPLGYGLDEQAVKALGQWKFEPATKDGQPVPVSIKIEMNFRLY